MSCMRGNGTCQMEPVQALFQKIAVLQCRPASQKCFQLDRAASTETDTRQGLGGEGCEARRTSTSIMSWTEHTSFCLLF